LKAVTPIIYPAKNWIMIVDWVEYTGDRKLLSVA
jgi:hypothetical protein